MKVVFFGTSSFAARIFQFLIENQVDICAVVTRPDRPKGRSLHLSLPPVKEVALKLAPHLPIHQPEKASTPEFEEILRAFNPDLFVVVAYGEIIKQHLLDLPKLDCINIHASLLPRYRGAAPIQRALMDGVKETGITIIEMSAKMDAGDILAIRAFPVSQDMTFGELEPQLCQLGSQLVLEVIHQFESHTVHKTPQDHSQATFAPKLSPADEEIRWERSALEIHNQIRGLSPFPSAWCKVQIGTETKRLKIKKSLPVNLEEGDPGKSIKLDKQTWVVGCGKGALQLLEVQLEGKRSMPVSDFLKGIHCSVQVLI